MYYPGFRVNQRRAETAVATVWDFLNLISLFTDILFLKQSHTFSFTAATKCAPTQAFPCINPAFGASACIFPNVFCRNPILYRKSVE